MGLPYRGSDTLPAELSELRQRQQHNGDDWVVDSDKELSSPERPMVDKKHDEWKRRKTKGASPFFPEQLTNILLDVTRFAGDDTLGSYSGTLKEFIINLQLNLRTAIAAEDAFPKSAEFEGTIRVLFEDRAQEALERKSK